MSLIIWMDFWDWDGNAASLSATALVATSPLVTGTARGKSTPNNTYQMLPDDYWDERESRLKADPPKADPSLPPEDKTQAAPPAPKPDGERAGLLESMRNAGSLDELKSISAQLRG